MMSNPKKGGESEGGNSPPRVIHRCQYCGELPHGSPQQNKNCVRRHRARIQSSPKAPKARQIRFKSAYLKRLYRLDILRDEE